MHLEAVREGYLFDKQVGVGLLVKSGTQSEAQAVAAGYDDDKGIVHEVKRKGFLIDRFVDI